MECNKDFYRIGSCLHKRHWGSSRSNRSQNNFLKTIQMASILLAGFFSLGSSVVTAEPSCHPFALNSCALPFPSNYWTKPSSQYSTNLVVDVPDDLLSQETLDALPVGGSLSPQSLSKNIAGEAISGFSPVSGVYFEVNDNPNSGTIAAPSGTHLDAGEESAFIYNKTTGQKVPAVFQLARQAIGTGSYIAELRPLSRFEPGHTYIAGTKRHFRSEKGVLYDPPPGLQKAFDDENSEEYAHIGSAIEFLAGVGLDKSEISNLTEFTIREETEMTTHMRQLVNRVHADTTQDSEPVEIVRVEYFDAGSLAARVVGRMKTYNYRSNSNMVAFSDNAEPTPLWVKFRLTIPKTVTTDSAPVAIYGHGLGGEKEMMDDLSGQIPGDIDLPFEVRGLAMNNALLGMATIAIDFPNHGERILTGDEFKLRCEVDEEDPDAPPPQMNDDGECIFDPMSFEFAGETRIFDKRAKGIIALTDSPVGADDVIGIAQQGVLDLTTLMGTIQNQLKDLDVVPEGGDGKADLDPTRMIYQGQSLGSVFGSGFVAMAPDLMGAFFQVGGAGITNVLLHSDTWDNFGNLVPEEATPGELFLMVNLYQMAIDGMDGLNTAHWIKNPPPGIPAKAVVLQYGIDDRIVPNIASIAYGLALDAPLLDDENVDVRDAKQAGFFENDTGIVDDLPEDLTVVIQNEPPISLAFLQQINSTVLFPTLSHISMVQPGAINTLEKWARQLNVDGDPTPEPDPNEARGLGGGGTPSIDSGASEVYLVLLLSFFAVMRRRVR